MRKQTIKIQTVEGECKTKAFVRKNLAINKNKGMWTITYIPSGRCFPGFYSSKKEAIKVSKIIRQKPLTSANYAEAIIRSGVNLL